MPRSIRPKLNISLWDRFFPPVCSYCRRPIPHHFSLEGICPKCFSAFPLRPPEHSQGILDDPGRTIGAVCFPLFVASYYEDIVKQAVRGIKFHDRPDFAKSLGEILALFWQRTLNEKLNSQYEELNRISYLVPLPLHTKRLKERGYNQAQLLAEEMLKAGDFSLELRTDILVRQKPTKRQSEASGRLARLDNVRGAFGLKEPEIKQSAVSKSVLLLDDVLSSGASLYEAAKVLYNGGYEVYILALASERPI